MLKKDAIEFYDGSVSRLAEILGIDRRAVYQWGELVPERRAIKLAQITGGALIYESSVYEGINPGPKKGFKSKEVA